MQRIHNTVIASLIVAGSILCGCQGAQSHSLGIAFTPTTLIPVQALASQSKAAPIIVEGEMIEKCPVAGCWFILKDKTGVVRVDTKSAGFVVSEVPLHSRLTVAGTLTPGAQPGIAATGVRY
jgi:hypothetical protein